MSRKQTGDGSSDWHTCSKGGGRNDGGEASKVFNVPN